jgi:hypothetical protein
METRLHPLRWDRGDERLPITELAVEEVTADLAKKARYHSIGLGSSPWHAYRYISGMREHGDPEATVEVTPATPSVTSSVGSTTVGTLWTLAHESEGTVSLNVGPHPHGFELRVILNNRFLRSRVHREFTGVLADANDTRERFEELGFAELRARFVH